MSLMQALLQRLLPLFGGLFASQVETGIVLEQAEQLNAIEAACRGGRCSPNSQLCRSRSSSCRESNEAQRREHERIASAARTLRESTPTIPVGPDFASWRTSK